MKRHELIASAAALGWDYAGRTGKSHLKFRHPTKGTLFTSCSPSDIRAWMNALARMRRQPCRHPARGAEQVP